MTATPPGPADRASDESRRAHLARLGRLRAFLAAEGVPAALIVRPEHIRYLTGWAGPGPAMLLLAGDAFLVVPAGSYESTSLDGLAITAMPYVAYDPHRLVYPVASWRVAALELIARIGLRGRVGVEPDRLPIMIASAIPAFAPTDVDRELAAWRRIKDPLERAAIRRSVGLLDTAFRVARDTIRPGLRELDLFATLEGALVEATGSPVRLDSNVSSGPRTTLEDPHQTDRTLEIGDLVLIDLYPVIDGYVADLTRVFVVGRATSEQRERHAVLEAALALGAAALRPGARARDIDRIVRDELQRSRPELAASMTHHTGHGIGLEAWEDPWIGRASEFELASDMVVALEPGLYVSGVEGMRLEGNFLVGADEADRLDAFPWELTECDA